jgi:hypothetical protein
MPARSQNLKVGIGFKRQTGTGEVATTATELQTALTAAELWSLGDSSFSIPFPEFTQENDAAFFGKGHEWSTQVFPTSISIPWSWDYHLTSQNWAQVICFALGKIVESTPGVGATQYVVTPQEPGVTGVNLPATTIVADILAGGALEILDIAAVGVVCAGFSLKLQRGPGLQNTQISSQWMGCGKYVNNSGVVVPAATVEQRLGAGSATAITINGVNYIANARFVDLDFSYQNNPIVGFYPGSGSQSSFDIAGRMRMGTRSATLSWQVELEADSDELADLLAGTEGTATITIEGPTIVSAIKHTAQIVLHRTRNRAYKMGEVDGFVTARVDTEIMYHASNGLMTLTAITTQALIGAEA